MPREKPRLNTFRTTYRIEGKKSQTRNVQSPATTLDTDTLAEIRQILADAHGADAIDIDIVTVSGLGQTIEGDAPADDPPPRPSIDELGKMPKSRLVEVGLSVGLEIDPAAMKSEVVRQMVVGHFYPPGIPKAEPKPEPANPATPGQPEIRKTVPTS